MTVELTKEPKFQTDITVVMARWLLAFLGTVILIAAYAHARKREWYEASSCAVIGILAWSEGRKCLRR